MIKNWIDDANNRSAKKLENLCNQYESLNRESEELSRSIDRAPPEKALSELVKDLGIKSERIGIPFRPVLQTMSSNLSIPVCANLSDKAA
mgnify:CR=1 FL=1